MSSVLKSKIETKAQLGRPTKAGTAQETGGQDACAAGETRGSVYDGRHNSPGDRRPGLSSTFVFTEEARGCKMTRPGEHSHTCIRRDKSSPRGEGAPRKAASQTQPGAAARPAPQLPKTDPRGGLPGFQNQEGRDLVSQNRTNSHNVGFQLEPGHESLIKALAAPLPAGGSTSRMQEGRSFWNMELDMAS